MEGKSSPRFKTLGATLLLADKITTSAFVDAMQLKQILKSSTFLFWMSDLTSNPRPQRSCSNDLHRRQVEQPLILALSQHDPEKHRCFEAQKGNCSFITSKKSKKPSIEM
jgi:hypothetical protein